MGINISQQCVLAVEDDWNLLTALEAFLKSAGFAVLTARNGPEALKLMEGAQPDVIVSDIRMPGMDGYELYEKIRARPEWESIPFIFFTILSDRAHIRRAEELGVDMYFTKPGEPENLLAAIREQLEQGRLGQSATELI